MRDAAAEAAARAAAAMSSLNDDEDDERRRSVDGGGGANPCCDDGPCPKDEGCDEAGSPPPPPAVLEGRVADADGARVPRREPAEVQCSPHKHRAAPAVSVPADWVQGRGQGPAAARQWRPVDPVPATPEPGTQPRHGGCHRRRRRAAAVACPVAVVVAVAEAVPPAAAVRSRRPEALLEEDARHLVALHLHRQPPEHVHHLPQGNPREGRW